MRYQVWLAAFVAAVTAAPHAQVETALPPISVSESFATPTITVIPTTSLNIPYFTDKKEAIALGASSYLFQKLRLSEKCNFEENHSWVCWTSANYGCPSPTRACSDLFSPTPVTGKHPCELGPGVRPEPTEVPILRF
ncbi:hypothetical protein BU24DRAFT_461643 [Aaosphaeria arxii CBS 175.79]|uniref:Uncharacterized protein n=1 Tax=Aaosphaeria arxii CBS 175.79 TaxID=1450172 RepID=A0A6A5XT21_9PLEO|nr:uncharacterized protein BU24DRAFT_461643 [Aaosphaeria arxii CBS 175.79]KAF2015394.1 hypothetical protein BU24DRAFT_461643 [Aaosphaeria arxii CBS 175.79]